MARSADVWRRRGARLPDPCAAMSDDPAHHAAAASTSSACATSARSAEVDGHCVVLRPAIDQLVERIDAGAGRLARYGHGELGFFPLDLALFEEERLAVGIEHADVDPVRQRHVVLLAQRVGTA